MGRGRKPTSPKLKLLAGTDRPDRATENAVEFDLVKQFPDPPQHLDAVGAAMWDDLGPQLVTAGVLSVVDLYPLQQLCYCWSRHVRKQKAEIDITASEDNALKSLFSEFGMSWNARQKKIGSGVITNPHNRFSKHGKKPGA